MSDPELTEAFVILRQLTPEFAHDLIDALERRMVVAETVARSELARTLELVELDPYSRKVAAFACTPDESVNPEGYPVNRGTPAHDLDGYALDDPKRQTLS